jgi:hypothetical protein
MVMLVCLAEGRFLKQCVRGKGMGPSAFNVAGSEILTVPSSKTVGTHSSQWQSELRIEHDCITLWQLSVDA